MKCSKRHGDGGKSDGARGRRCHTGDRGCTGEVAMICSHAGGAHIRRCKLGGIGGAQSGDDELPAVRCGDFVGRKSLKWDVRDAGVKSIIMEVELHKLQLVCSPNSSQWKNLL
eukprot:760055-Hanusia_phi.AAC.4